MHWSEHRLRTVYENVKSTVTNNLHKFNDSNIAEVTQVRFSMEHHIIRLLGLKKFRRNATNLQFKRVRRCCHVQLDFRTKAIFMLCRQKNLIKIGLLAVGEEDKFVFDCFRQDILTYCKHTVGLFNT